MWETTGKEIRERAMHRVIEGFEKKKAKQERFKNIGKLSPNR